MTECAESQCFWRDLHQCAVPLSKGWPGRNQIAVDAKQSSFQVGLQIRIELLADFLD